MCEQNAAPQMNEELKHKAMEHDMTDLPEVDLCAACQDVEKVAVSTYQKIEDAVVGGYKAIENGVFGISIRTVSRQSYLNGCAC